MSKTMSSRGLCILILLVLCLHASSEATNSTSSSSPDTPSDELLDQKLKEAFESAQRTLDTYNGAKSKLLVLSKEIIDKKEDISSRMEEILTLKEEVANMTESVDQRTRHINAQQVLRLKDQIELLHTRELERRALMRKKEEFEKRRLEKREAKKKREKEKRLAKKRRLREKKKRKRKREKELAKASGKTKYYIPEGAIKKDELQNFVDIKALLEESDKRIEDLFVDIMEQEVDALQGELEETVIEATTALQQVEEEEKEKEQQEALEAAREGADDQGECSGATLTDAVQMVHEALVKFSHDKVGMVDHLERAHVVHHLTSKNFVPPAYSYQSLDELWWFQYIPEDWEKGLDWLFTESWRKWNTMIPDYIFHTFGMYAQAKTAPPEAILRPSLHPGSCWPMDGQQGQVTLRLPYPVKVKAITLDHAPSLLFEDQTKRHSAPRKVRVFGFPPCWTKKVAEGDVKKSDYLQDYRADSDDDDAEYFRGTCDDGLDFDVSKPVVLHDIEYDLEGPSIQTFHIPLPDEEEEDEDDSGSCSQDTGSCSGSLDPNDYLLNVPERSDTIAEGMSAIRLEVTDNWGNKDYTCIYRFRIHGDAMDPSV